MDVDRIAETAETLTPEATLDAVLGANENARPCLTSSFQAEDMAVLHLLRKRIPDVPVLFLDTGYHFPQTYEYRDRLAKEWSLNLVNVLPAETVAQQESAFGILYRSDPTRCCQLRKVEPLLSALEPFDVWFTGLRREQSPTRKNLKKVELHRLTTGKSLWKVDEGYLSIGCQPCTALPVDPNNPRSGRWGGTKLECGIHTFSKQTGA